MVRRGDTGAAAQDDLRGHEFAVVLSECAGERFVAGIAGVTGCGPLPYVAEALLEGAGRNGGDRLESTAFQEVGERGLVEAGAGMLPLEFGGQSTASPAGEGVRLKEAEMADRGV